MIHKKQYRYHSRNTCFITILDIRFLFHSQLLAVFSKHHLQLPTSKTYKYETHAYTRVIIFISLENTVVICIRVFNMDFIRLINSFVVCEGSTPLKNPSSIYLSSSQYIFLRSVLILFFHLLLGLPRDIFQEVSPPTLCMRSFSFPFWPHVLIILT
jgi:hypothetical protein